MNTNRFNKAGGKLYGIQQGISRKSETDKTL